MKSKAHQNILNIQTCGCELSLAIVKSGLVFLKAKPNQTIVRNKLFLSLMKVPNFAFVRQTEFYVLFFLFFFIQIHQSQLRKEIN
jgi:hypothetical protein